MGTFPMSGEDIAAVSLEVPRISAGFCRTAEILQGLGKPALLRGMRFQEEENHDSPQFPGAHYLQFSGSVHNTALSSPVACKGKI